MDRTDPCGGSDAGSIPAEGTMVRQVIRPGGESDDFPNHPKDTIYF